MYEKHKRKLMMEHNVEDEIYQRRKTRWLSYGRALLTIGVLGLLTVLIFTLTQSGSPSNESEHQSRVVVIDDYRESFGKEGIVESGKIGETPFNDQSTSLKIVKRAVDLRSNDNSINTPKNLDSSEQILLSLNDVNSEVKKPTSDNQHLKQLRRQSVSGANQPHRHPDGDVYYFKGYKCVPIRKPSKQLELLRERQRSSGMLCCFSQFVLSCLVITR